MQTVLTPEIVDVTTICTNCPRKIAEEISRDNILHTLGLMFQGDTELVTVYGDEGIGKTTILAQFARRNAQRALCLFVKASSRFGYDPELLTLDLCNQTIWLLGKRDTPPVTDPGSFPRLVYELQRNWNVKKGPYYFIIDGLGEIPAEDVHLRDERTWASTARPRSFTRWWRRPPMFPMWRCSRTCCMVKKRGCGATERIRAKPR